MSIADLTATEQIELATIMSNAGPTPGGSFVFEKNSLPFKKNHSAMGCFLFYKFKLSNPNNENEKKVQFV